MGQYLGGAPVKNITVSTLVYEMLAEISRKKRIKLNILIESMIKSEYSKNL